jgi:hypothetical protein
MEHEVFKYPVKKHPKVVKRKLGQHKAHAQYYSEGIIEIDVKFKGKKELFLYVHEYLHHLNPEWTEDEVIAYSESIGDFLWKNKYRKIDDEEE